MLQLPRDLAIQSWCFRHFKALPDLIAQIQSLGITRTELCACHLEFDIESAWEPGLQLLRNANIAIPSIGVQTFRGDSNEEKWCRFAQIAGSKMIAASFDLKAMPNVIPHVERLAEKYDLLIGIHNHGGYDWLGNFKMISHILETTGPRIGLCLDTAWCMQAGEKPLHWIEKLRPKLFALHLKDFTFDRTGKWSDVVVGTGALPLREVLTQILAAPNLHTLTLEYEGDIENPRPKLRECIAAIGTASVGN